MFLQLVNFFKHIFYFKNGAHFWGKRGKDIVNKMTIT